MLLVTKAQSAFVSTDLNFLTTRRGLDCAAWLLTNAHRTADLRPLSVLAFGIRPPTTEENTYVNPAL